ncbi:MAG: hypothetical protein IMZ53_06655 [Thermoplasmata archaeon]|nr:hypothetical protein [Thermoplasmata archaeon]
MKGIDILNEASKALAQIPTELRNELSLATHARLLELHARVLACHCECLGMNAENAQRTILGQSMSYRDDSYLDCMKKWGLINEEGIPTI